MMHGSECSVHAIIFRPFATQILKNIIKPVALEVTRIESISFRDSQGIRMTEKSTQKATTRTYGLGNCMECDSNGISASASSTNSTICITLLRVQPTFFFHNKL